MPKRPAILRVGAEQRVVLAAVGRLGERTIEAVLRGQPVLGIDLRGRAAITITDLGADGRQVGEGPGAAGHHRIVVGVAAMVVVHGQLAATVHIQRRADAVGVACCSQHAGHVATTAAGFLHPAQLGRQAIVLADPPFGSGLCLDQRLRTTTCLAVACVQAEVVGHITEQLGALFAHPLAGIEAPDRIATVHLPPPGTRAPVALGPAQLTQVDA
ncbi:hypothetical protein G6F58_012670 [Rhizopus delemar]|nr:hypothetical protein G6F58_012670 [Rhizopus delemar]